SAFGCAASSFGNHRPRRRRRNRRLAGGESSLPAPSLRRTSGSFGARESKHAASRTRQASLDKLGQYKHSPLDQSPKTPEVRPIKKFSGRRQPPRLIQRVGG